jgi:hypothetical protein
MSLTPTYSSTPTAPARRQPLDYFTAVKKGHKLLHLMRSPHAVPDPIAFTLDSIRKYGYESERYGCAEHIEDHIAMLTSLGTDDYVRAVVNGDNMGGDNIDITFTHSTDVVLDGISIPQTGAYFASILNIKAGMLTAANNFTPEAKRAIRYCSTLSEKQALPPLPTLRHWSDIAFLQWSLLPSMNLPVPPLNYVFRQGIVNQDTLAIISAVVGYDCGYQGCHGDMIERPRWPGVDFPIDTWEGLALLGTPNGSGVGWLLAQHKRELGHRVVEKVSVLFSDDGHDEVVNLLFYVIEASAAVGALDM